MPIELAPHDPRWSRSFVQARDELTAQVGEGTFRSIEHIGSTSVPGLSAKPIVDIAASVDDLNAVTAFANGLAELGYVPWWGGDGRITFQRRDSRGRPTHNLHIVVHDGQKWRDYLRFRDSLRANCSHRAAYEGFKRKLAARFDDSREYSRAKTDFIRNVLESRVHDEL